jgi:septal ring factor EnvC (AmiA/AmiB activator)
MYPANETGLPVGNINTDRVAKTVATMLPKRDKSDRHEDTGTLRAELTALEARRDHHKDAMERYEGEQAEEQKKLKKLEQSFNTAKSLLPSQPRLRHRIPELAAEIADMKEDIRKSGDAIARERAIYRVTVKLIEAFPTERLVELEKTERLVNSV